MQTRKKKKRSSKRKKWMVVLIIVLSVFFRGIYFLQLNDSQALLHMHKWTESDMHFYYEWGKIISDGDVLTDRPYYPYNFWQKQVANHAFENYPSEIAELIGKTPPNMKEEARNRLLWEYWVGEKSFYSDPLYPYWVAANFKIFGMDVRWIFLWQLILGIGSNVLIYLITVRYFGEKTGIVAAAMAILCAPLMYNEMILIRATWMTFTGLLLVYALDQLLTKTDWRAWFLYGLFLGICMLIKSVYVLWFGYVVVLLIWRFWKMPKKAIQLGLLLVFGMYIGRAPLTVRNLVVDLSTSNTSSYGVTNFIIPNVKGYNVATGAIDLPTYTDLMLESKGSMSIAIQKTLQTHNGSGSYFQLLGEKLRLTLNGYEIADNANFYYYRLHAPILKYLFFSFYWIAPLGIIGFILALIHLKSIWRPLYAFVALQVALLLFFFVLSRLRVPLLATMVPFAAYCVVFVGRNRNWRGGLVVLGILGLAYWVNLPVKNAKIRHADYLVSYNVYYNAEIGKVLQTKNFQKATEILQESLKYQPADFERILEGGKMTEPLHVKKSTVNFYSDIYTRQAIFYRKMGDLTNAELWKLKAELLKRSK